MDSGLVLKVAKDIVGERVVAVTASSCTYPSSQLKEAKEVAKEIGVRHIVVETNEFKDKNFITNTPRRCYWCKRHLFSKLTKVRNALAYKFIVDGTTYQDKQDNRPGRRANTEFGVISPLFECKFTKQDVRSLAKYLKLSFWNKPKGTCLASRIQFNEEITLDRIKRIEKAEQIVREFLKFPILFRLRDHERIARLEFEAKYIPSIIKKKGWANVIRQLKTTGYKYVVVDLEGYIPQGKR